VQHDLLLQQEIEKAVEGWQRARAEEAAAAAAAAAAEAAAAEAAVAAEAAAAKAVKEESTRHASLALPPSSRTVLGALTEETPRSGRLSLRDDDATSTRDRDDLGESSLKSDAGYLEASERLGSLREGSERWDGAEADADADVDADVLAAMEQAQVGEFLEFSDPETGKPYWVNTSTGATTTEPPAI